MPVCSCTTGVYLSVNTFVSQSLYASMNVVSLVLCVGMLSRIITSGAIFQKSLQLDQKKMGKLTISKVLNLAAADAGSLDFVSTCAAFSYIVHMFSSLLASLIKVTRHAHSA